MPRKVKSRLSDEKRNIIGQMVDMYDIKTEADIQEALKDLLGGTIQSMLETELTTQMAERKDEDPDYSDSRDGYKPKSLRSSMGEIPISVPQERNSDFDPQIVPLIIGFGNISRIPTAPCRPPAPAASHRRLRIPIGPPSSRFRPARRLLRGRCVG